MVRYAVVGLLLGALTLSCGGSSDPLVERCEAACNNVSPPSPCANDASKSKCLNDCRALASQAQTSNGKSCGECIAESFRYSAKPGCENDPSCCWGTAHANPTDDSCKAKCFEPDAGVAW
jgi:hypothetical protein